MRKIKDKYESQNSSKFISKIVPNTPMKQALWASVIIGIGATVFLAFNKKN